jgi:carboxymethylenebutenolidase
VHVGAAEIDPTFDSAQAQRLRDAFDAAGVRYSFEVHQGAKHGFAVTNHLAYDRAASERHWTVLTDLLRTHLAASSPPAAVAADAD